MTAQKLMKQAKQVVSSKSEKIEQAANEAKQAAKVVPIFSPSQVIEQFSTDLAKDTRALLLPAYDELLEEFATEGNSRIAIGSTLVRIRGFMGEHWGLFLEKCVVKALNKVKQTCYNYIGLAQVFNLKFDRNRVVRTALLRIWDGQGCYDTENGELKPVVDTAIKANGGIPESTDSQTCEVWARQFVDTVNKLVRQANGRSASPDGRSWDVETMKKKHEQVILNFTKFITHKNVSTKRATALLTDILVVAMTPSKSGYLQLADVNTAFVNAKDELAKQRTKATKAKQDNEIENAILPADMPEKEQIRIAREA